METPLTSEVDHPPMLSLPEAAAMLRCHPNTVRAWVRQGKLVPIPMGPEKVGMFLLADVERLKTPLEQVGVIVKEDKHAFPVVGIGASAGGLDAMSRLLAHLPTDLGLAYVLVTHQEQGQEKTLSDLLRKKTTMPVFVVENGMMLDPDRLYVAPANMSTAVVNGSFTLRAWSGAGAHRPIDAFFTALASEFQNNAIGILLSGGGIDGTEGLRSIKAEDGLTIVQDASAQDASMPMSAQEAGVADLVRSPEEIGGELAQLVKELFAGGMARIPSKHDNEMRRILQYLLEQRGVDFSDYKEATIHRRIIRRMVLSKCNKLSDYATLLRGTPTEVDTLCNDLLINVTSFFRDPAFHKALTEKVFPDLFGDRTIDPLRIWVAACAGGEEVVSIAITLLEFLGDRAGSTPVQIFATDLNERTIEKARLGIYKKSALQDLDPALLEKYFMHVDGHYQVIKSIRDLCVFAKHDLLKDPPFSRVDLISCQNVLIYLENAAQGRVLKSFHYALKPTGYLALGKSETTGTAEGYFAQPDRAHRVYQKKRKGRARLPADLHFRPEGAGTPLVVTPVPQLRPMTSHPDLDRTLEQLLLHRYVPASVLVNKDLEIVRFLGATAPYLAPSAGRATLSLLKMVRDDLAFELRALLQKARREKIAVRKSGIPVRLNTGLHDVALEVVPVGDPRDQHYLVLFKEEARIPEPSPSNGAAKRGNTARDQRIATLEQELRDMREQVRQVSEEAEINTQELQAANEEVVSSNEELQSINEEMETSKEELQSINEEYATINEELRMRNDALLESEERLRLATKTGKVGLWDWDIVADQITWSDSLYEIHGVKKETFEANVKSFASLVHTDDRDRVGAAIDHAIKHDARYELEFRAVRPNGEVFWLFTTASVLRVDGRAVRMTGATLDITERKNAESALQHRTRALELMNAMGDTLISELDTQKIVQAVTDTAREVSGAAFGAFFYNVTNAEGDSFMLYTLSGLPREAFERFGMPRATELFGPTFRGEGVLRIADVHKDPRYGKMAPHHGMPKGHPAVRSFLAVPVTSRDGKVLGGLFFGHPETGRFTQEGEEMVTTLAAQAALAIDNADLHTSLQRELEQQRVSTLALAEAHEKLNNTLGSITDGLVVLDNEWRYTYFSEQAGRIIGADPQAFLGKVIWDLFPDAIGTSFEKYQRLAVETQKTQHFEEFYAEPINKWLELHCYPSPLGLSVYFQDVSERKNAEHALRAVQARLSLALDSAELGTWNIDGKVENMTTDERFNTIFGWGERTINVEQAFSCLHPDDRERISEAIAAATRPEDTQPYEVEYRVVHPDGSIHWVLAKGRSTFTEGANGKELLSFDGTVLDITARKRAEEEQFRLAAIVESSYDAILSRDLNGTITSWNKGAERIFGYTAAEIVGKSNHVLHPPDRREEEDRLLDLVRQGKLVEHYETVRLHKDGTPVDVALTLSPLKNDKGEIIGASKVIRDITDQKRSREAIRAGEERFHLLADNIGQLAWIAEPDGEIHWYNKRWFEYSGTTLEEMRGWGWQKIHHPDHVDRVTEKFKEHIQAEKDWEDTFPIRGADGEYHWFLSRAFPVRDAEGKVLRWFGTNTDVTEERLAREKALRSEERFRMLADHMSQMAYVADAQGAITWVNRRWIDFTGMNVEEMNDGGWGKAVDPAHFEAMVNSYAMAQERKETWEHIFRLRSTEGEYRWFLSRSVPIVDQQGNVQRWFGTNTDITEQKLAEEALEESARHKDHFLATLAHELRNPLAPLKNGLQLMELAPDDPQILETTRAMMVRQLDHMVRLVDDLMDLSRISRGKIELIKQDVKLAEVIGTAMEASKPLIERNVHQLNVDMSAEELLLHGDAARLTQVVSNLLNNAAKYTPRGGRIDLGVHREDGSVVISVKDNGIGIDPSAIGRVFDMFAQVDPQQKGQNAGGLGIGLNVVKRLVQMHNGEVIGRSEGLGKGSEFIVRLPLIAATEKPKTVEPRTEATAISRRVLVVDDNEDIALSMSLILKKTGHVVAVAHDGTEAVTMVETFKPDVILMDIGMPRMNGYEACAAIRDSELGKRIHIIAVSGWGQDEDRKKSQDAGFDGHVVKPMERYTLERVIAEAQPHGGADHDPDIDPSYFGVR